MKIIKMVIKSGLMLFVGGFLATPRAGAYNLTTGEIYRQARLENYQFMQWISNYRNAIDVQNAQGDTAYCLALRYKDQAAQHFLISYGANPSHSCVKKVYSDRSQDSKYARATRDADRYPMRSPDTLTYGSQSSNNYLWWGLGALAVGGGVAALASSGGGGGGSHSSGNNNSGNGDNNSGNNGDNNSGNNGDNNSGNNGDNNSGNNSNNNPGGNDGSDGLTQLSAEAFRTAEYNKGNFLDGVKAAEAYSVIYKKDAQGNLVSHQAASDDPLKKVKVGIVDTGVYNHEDLAGKITGTYDANQYNTQGKVWGYANGDRHFYIFYKDDKYYLMFVNTKNNPVSVTPFSGLTQADINDVLSQVNMSFSDFTLMNGSGGGSPGVSLGDFKENDVGTWWDVINGLSHGTHIAGVIAGNKDGAGMHGIAFENAEIYAGSWDYSQGMYSMVKRMIDDDVKVLNHSWGYVDSNASNPDWLYSHNSRGILQSYAYAAKNGAVWVQATGNERMTEAGVQSAMGLLDMSSYGYDGPGEYEVPYLAVTALDGSSATSVAPVGQIASYANWCGSAKGYCLAAPGTKVNSTVAVENGYMNMDGTSMATPVVSGSIALLMGYYPYLSAQNIAWLLLEKANRDGVYADSDIYGRGVLDLERALTPVGQLSVATTNSFESLRPASSSRLNMSGALQTQLSRSMPKKITTFDALHRPYEYDTSNMISKTHGSNAHLRNVVSHAGLVGKQKVIRDEDHGLAFTTREAMNKQGTSNLSDVDVKYTTTTGETHFYYSENSKYADSDKMLQSSNNPYLAMNEAYGVEDTMNLSENSKLKLSIQTGENGMYDRDYEQDRQSFDERSYSVGAEYSFGLTDYLELAANGGMLYEEDAMLGMNGRGGFAIRDGSTYYMGIKAKLNLTDNITILAAYYRGYTSGQETSMLSLSGIETESYMLSGEYSLDQKNKIGLSFASPLTVRRGTARFAYASGRDNNSDRVYMEKLTSTLRPAAQEYDLGLYYKGEPKEDFNLMGKVEARFNADGEKGTTDYWGVVGISKAF